MVRVPQCLPGCKFASEHVALLIIMKVVPLVVVGLALLVAVRAQDEESQESKDAAEAKEPKAQQEAKQEGGKKRKQEVKEPEAEVEQNEACWC